MSTRENILKEAGKLFYREGVHAIGMEAICQSAGITKPTLYYYFKSKDDLITSYISDTAEHIFIKFQKTIENTQGSILDKLIAMVDLNEHMVTHPKWNGCAFHRLASDLNGNKEHSAYISALEFKSKWEKWLIEYLRKNSISDPEKKARMFIISLDGAVAHATLHRDNSYFKNAKQVAEILF